MEVIFILVPVSLLIIGGALWAFVWSVRNDQFEDLDKEAYSILFDEDTDEKTEIHTKSSESRRSA